MTERISPDAHLFPASPGQQRLWFLDRMSPAAGRAYTLAVRIELRGELRRTALQTALNAVVARHEALRTGLRQVDGRLTQVVLPGVLAALPLADLTSYGPDRHAERDLLRRREAQRGWNMAQPPLLRALLIRLEPDHHELVLCVHHAVCDGLSLLVVLRELLAHYAGAEPDGEAPPQFADYVMWSAGDGPGAGGVTAEHRGAAREFFTAALRGAPLVLELPTDHRRPALQSYAGDRVPVRVDVVLADRLRRWSAARGVTLFSTLLTAYALVLARTAGADDLLVGLPVGNRAHAELDGTVGYLANTCPIRVDLRADPSLAEAVTQTHAALGGVLKHSGLPFGELVEMLSPPRSPDRSPVFQAMFGLQQDVRRDYALPSLRAEVADVDCGASRVDLSLFLFEERAGEVSGFLEYATELFERPTVAGLAARFRAVLGRLPEDASAAVSAVPLAAAPEAYDGGRAGRLDGGALAERRPPVWEQIRAVAARTPDAVAVVDDTGTLGYRRLIRRVTAVSSALRAAGARPGDHVAVHTERDARAVVAMLACWDAGCVYVPVDPAAPADRRRAILEGADPAVVLCTDPDLVPDGHRSRALAVGRDAAGPEPGTAEPPGSGGPGPRDAAYVMFTSGSTGRPKGVVVGHDRLGGFLQAVGERIGPRAGDRLLALTTTSFDISLLELLGPLVAGGTVVVAPAGVQQDAAALADRLADPAVTMAQATPAGWRLAAAAGWRPRPGLAVLCGGEALPDDLGDLLAGGSAAAHNLYGPTETTIWSCSARLRSGERVVIGEPLPGTHVVVADGAMRPVPRGVCGELLVGGAGVALGYLGDPARTAARFLPDPARPGERLYRTGDLVRQRADGALEFIGRADDQVKVRGNRVELGEIEQALRALDGVTDAAATVRDAPGGARIAGYLVAAGGVLGGEGTAAALRQALARTLPTALLPSELYEVDAIPLNPSGKTDRRALAGTGRPLTGAAERVAPRTPAERAVAALWCELLQVPEVGVHDDFFLLGGHSALAATLLQRAELELAARVPVAEFFMEPTVARIAAAGGGAAPPPDPAGAAVAGAAEGAAAEPADGWDFPTVHRSPTRPGGAHRSRPVSQEVPS